MQEDFLTRIYEGVSGRFLDLCFAMSCASVSSDTQIPVLTINQHHLFIHPPYGMVSCIQGYVQYKTCSVHVLMRLWRKDNFEDIEEITALCGIVGEPWHYKFYPGISLEQYIKEYYDVIRFHIKVCTSQSSHFNVLTQLSASYCLSWLAVHLKSRKIHKKLDVVLVHV